MAALHALHQTASNWGAWGLASDALGGEEGEVVLLLQPSWDLRASQFVA